MLFTLLHAVARFRVFVEICDVRVHLGTGLALETRLRLHIGHRHFRRWRHARVPRLYMLLEVRARRVDARTVAARHCGMAPEIKDPSLNLHSNNQTRLYLMILKQLSYLCVVDTCPHRCLAVEYDLLHRSH